MKFDANAKYESFGVTFKRVGGRVLATIINLFILGVIARVNYWFIEAAFDMHKFVGGVTIILSVLFWLRFMGNIAKAAARARQGY